MALSAAVMVFFVFSGLFILGSSEDLSVVARVIFTAISVSAAFLCWKGICFFRTRIEFDETGFTQIDGSRRVRIDWPDVVSVDAFTLAGEIRPKNAAGDFATIRKGYIGSLDFIEMMRRQVPEGVWHSALRYYEPRSGGGGRPRAWGDPFNPDRSSSG